MSDTTKAMWQPIATAPRDGTHILAYGDSQHHERVMREIWLRWNEDYRFEKIDGDVFRRVACRSNERWETDGNFSPTHWMPLPEKPEQG